MKNYLKIKQGGFLGKKLRDARKIKVFGLVIAMLIASFAIAGSIESKQSTAMKISNVTAYSAGLGMISYKRNREIEPGSGGKGEPSPEQKLLNTIQSAVKSAIDLTKADNEKEVTALKSQLKELKEKAEASKEPDMIKAIADVQAQLKALSEAPAKAGKKALADVLKENKELLTAMAKGMKADELVVKATSNRASIANNQQAVDLPNIGQLATRKLSLYDIFPKINVGESNNNGVVRYYDWDEDTIARAAAAVAESGTFPESTAKFKKGSITLQKIGDTLPVTEEFFEDEDMFASELNLFLDINVQLEIDRQLADGDGTGNTITGLKSSVNAYSLPAVGTVENATIYDLIVKLSESITTTGGAKYQPNFAVMNIADINKMKLAKDANENYIMPPFVSRDGAQVGAITVMEANIITANTMVIGDSRFARIYEKGGIVLSKGLSGTQFDTDEMTLKARKRMAFLIRAADKGGFLKVTSITAAVAAIDTSNT